jgi:tetratricopeptide (TPR) repeat protein
MAAGLVDEYAQRGDFDEALARLEALGIPDDTNDAGLASTVLSVVRIRLERGEVTEAQDVLARHAGVMDEGDIQQRAVEGWRLALEAEVAGRLDEAGALHRRVVELSLEMRNLAGVAEALKDVADLALRTGDAEHALGAAALVEELPAHARTRSISSQLHRLRANVAAAAGDEAAAADRFGLGLAAARNLGFAFWLAPVLRDYGAWLAGTGRAEEAAPLLAEARALYERMGAVVWLDWIDALSAEAPAYESASGA